MNAKLDITLTDFIYAIVVGAAFQRIDAPIFSVQNLFLLIAFIVVIDDWVLYHTQATKVPDSQASFAKSLAIDALVLLLWYWAAVSGAHANETCYPFERDFYICLACFYIATCTWEIVFKGVTLNSARIVPDLVCAVVFIVCVLIHHMISFPYVAGPLVILWMAMRAMAWQKIVFN